MGRPLCVFLFRGLERLYRFYRAFLRLTPTHLRRVTWVHPASSRGFYLPLTVVIIAHGLWFVKNFFYFSLWAYSAQGSPSARSASKASQSASSVSRLSIHSKCSIFLSSIILSLCAFIIAYNFGIVKHFFHPVAKFFYSCIQYVYAKTGWNKKHIKKRGFAPFYWPGVKLTIGPCSLTRLRFSAADRP